MVIASLEGLVKMNWKLVASMVVGVIASSLVVVAFAASGSSGPGGIQEETPTSTETSPAATATDVDPTATLTASETETPEPPVDGSSAKVELCHVPPGNPENAHTISVAEDALEAHLAHGDAEGACPEEGSPSPPEGDGASGKVDLCHVPPGNPDNAHTISVAEDALEAHLAHGDVEGECP